MKAAGVCGEVKGGVKAAGVCGEVKGWSEGCWSVWLSKGVG